MTLQQQITDWHNRTFPGAPTVAIALKLGEESGELQKAVNTYQHSTRAHLKGAETVKANIAEEIGDVAICLMVLASRYDFDFEQIVVERITEVSQREAGEI